MNNTILTDKQWAVIAPHLPKQKHMGRPRFEDRKVMNGILYILRTGSRWADIPKTESYGNPVTCWRRLKEWEEAGYWNEIWKKVLLSLDKKKKVNWIKIFLDGSFAPAKKGGL